MATFPYVLLRVAGLPYSLMEQLRWESTSYNIYLKAAAALNQDRAELLSELESLIRIIEDYPAKYYLKILRSAVFSDRSIKVKSFNYHGKYTEAFSQVIEQVNQYKLNRETLTEQFDKLNIAYANEVVRTRRMLQDSSTSPVLIKGLQMASSSLMQRINSFRKQSPESFNKKHKQTERTVLQYLSRITTKVSPFSYFTQLSIWDLKQENIQDLLPKVRLNNQLFQLFFDALTHYPPFYTNLKVRWNPSAKLLEEQWTYLLNTRNVESIQRIDHSAVFDLMVKYLKQDHEVSFERLVNHLQGYIEEEREVLADYLSNLIDYGLIEWKWPFSGLDPDWSGKLIQLTAQQDDPLLKAMNLLLRQLEEWQLAFAEESVEARSEIQDKAYPTLQHFIEEQLSKITLPEQDLKNVSSLKAITLKKVSFPKEQLFYEDVSRKVEQDISSAELDSLRIELERLVNFIQPLNYKSERHKHELFFAEHFAGQEMPILTYYEAFYKAELVRPLAPEATIARHQEVLDKCLETGEWISADHFHLPLSSFQGEHSEDNNTHKSIGSLLQVYQEEGKTKVFVDAVIAGYGKMWGRFLHLFPKDIIGAIRDRNESLVPQAMIWAENIDASVYNPNIHPPLLQREVQVPGGQQLLPEMQQLRLEDLELRQQSSNHKIKLWHKPSGKEVKLFDFGFEAIENRSPLYRLLDSLFSYDLVGPNVLVNLLDQKISKKEDADIQHLPRITAGDHLVLRRRAWGIPKSFLPLKLKGEEELTYFVRIQDWIKTLNIPKRVFIRVSALNTEKRPKGDHYKPQYIDFDSIAFIDLFSRLLTKVTDSLLIEEMLPKAEGEMFVKELVLEMDLRE